MAPRSADSRRAGVWIGKSFVQPLARGHTLRHGLKFIQCGTTPVASAPPRQSAGKAKKNKKQKKKQTEAEKQAAVVKAPEPKKAAASKADADVSEKTAKKKKKALKHTKPTASFFEAGTIDESAFSGGFLNKPAPAAAKQAKEKPISFGNAFASPPAAAAAAAPADADAPPAKPHEKPSSFFKAGTIDASAFSGGFLNKPAPAAASAKASPAASVDPLTGQAKPEPVTFGNPFSSTAAAGGAASTGFSFGGFPGFNNASTDDAAIGESSPEYPEEVSENEESDCTPIVDAHCPLQTPTQSPPPPALPVLQSPPPRPPALEQASVQTKAVSPDSPSLMHLARQLSTRPPPLPLILEDPATAQLQEEVEVAGAEMRRLQQAMSRLQTDHDTLTAMHEGLKREKEIVDKAGERQSMRLIEEHHKLQAQVRDGEDSVEAVEHERDMARRNVARLERELASSKKRAEEAEAAAAASSDERLTAQAAVDTLERQSSVDVDLTRQLEDARGQLRAAKMQMAAEREEHSRVRKEHEAREKATNGELFELRSQLSAAQAQHSSSLAQAEAETRTLTRKEKSAAEKVGNIATRVLALLQKLSASVRLPEGQLLDEISRAEDDVRHFAGTAEQGLQRSGSSSGSLSERAAAPPAYGPRTPSQQRQSDAQTTRQVIDAEARASRAEARLSDSDRRCRELRKELEALRAPDAVAQREAAAGAARAAEQALEQRAKEAEAAAKAAAREVEAVRGDANLRVGRAEQRCETLEVRLRSFEERAAAEKAKQGAGGAGAQEAAEKARAEAAAAAKRAKHAEEAQAAAAVAAKEAETRAEAAEKAAAGARATAAEERSAKDAAVAAQAAAEVRAKAAEEAAATGTKAVQEAEARAETAEKKAASAAKAAAAAGVECGSSAKAEARAAAAEEQAEKAALGQKAAEARAEKAEATCAELRGAAAEAGGRSDAATRREEVLQARVDAGAEEQARLRAELKDAREAAKDAEEARAREEEKSVERARATVYEAGSHSSLAHREYEETNAEVKRLRAQVEALHSEVTEKAVALEGEKGKVKVLQTKRDYACDEAASLNRKVSFLHDEIAYFKGIFSSRDKLAEQVMKLDNELRSVRSAGSTARKQRYHTLHDGAEPPAEERRLTTPKKLFDGALSQDSAAGRASEAAAAAAAAAAPADAESVSSEGAPCRRVASTPLQKRRLDADASQRSTPGAKRARAEEDGNGHNARVFDESSASSAEVPAALPPASASPRAGAAREVASPRPWTKEEERVLAGFMPAFATNGKEAFVSAGQTLRRAPDDVARHFLEHEERLGVLAEEGASQKKSSGADGTA